MHFDLELDEHERTALHAAAETALVILAFVFLILLIAEFVLPLTPREANLIGLAGWIIWAIFTIEFFAGLILARDKLDFVKSHWLSALALILPAFRIFRVLEVVQLIRGARLVRLVAGVRRGSRALGRLVGVGGLAYVAGFTIMVWLVAAAGITWFERGQPGATITSFGTALWWAAATLTTIGSNLAPVTYAGKVLAVLLMVFALAISGYVTATLAVLLLGLRQPSDQQIVALHDEIRALRLELQSTRARQDGRATPSHD